MPGFTRSGVLVARQGSVICTLKPSPGRFGHRFQRARFLMRIVRFLIWPVVAVVLLAACSSRSGGSAASSVASGGLTATDTGVTASELHVAVIADVNIPQRPGLFQADVDAVRAWAGHLNESGGIAGRRIVVDFYDSKLSPDEWRNAVLQACAHDFAMVGTYALADSNVTDLVNCKIPDLAQSALSSFHAAAPYTYQNLPREPSKAPVGAQKWYLAKFKQDGCCHGLWLDPIGTPEALATAVTQRKAELQVGFTQARVFGASATESNFTPFALAIKDTNATYVYVGNDYNQTVALRREAKVQGVNSVVVWDCALQCYNPDFIHTGGLDVESNYVWNPYEPFEEASKNPGLQTYEAALKKYAPSAPTSTFSLGGWISGLLFQRAAQSVVSAKGNNGLTRANMVDALRGIHDFTADGIGGKVDIGNKKENACFMVMQVRGGQFVRVYPDKGLDCTASNVVTVTP